MNRKLAGLGIAAAALLGVPAGAQEAPKMTPEQQAEMEAYMKAGTPGPEHKALSQAAGTYDIMVKSWHAPGQPPMQEPGTATRKAMFDGRVLIEEVSSSMMGMPFSGHGMHGYDNVTGKHWSTWVDSMSTGVMLSEGTCDKDMSCTFTGTYNDPIKKGPAKLRMTTKWKNPNVEVFEMYGPAPDGSGEMKMMEITYTRKS